MSGNKNMTLVIDAGNTKLCAALAFETEEGRRPTFAFRSIMPLERLRASGDLAGLFAGILAGAGIGADRVARVGICSVVPSMDGGLAEACRASLGQVPYFISPAECSGLRVAYDDPRALGADRYAAALAAAARYPGEAIVVVDIGTACTVDAVDPSGTFLGGAIFPGPGSSAAALARETALLPALAATKPLRACGSNTEGCIHSGIYHAQLGAIRELIAAYRRERFGGRPVRVVATGGGASQFADAGLFDELAPDLVLEGTLLALPRPNAALACHREG